MMEPRTRAVCGGDHRIALVAMRGEVARHWSTPAAIALAVAAGSGVAGPALLVHGRLAPGPFPGGDLGLVWRSGVQTVAAIQQQAVDQLSRLLLASALTTLAIAVITILILALARENERAAELVVRRAVGAGRRVLLGTAVGEAAVIVLSGLVLGAVVALGVVATAPEWPGQVRGDSTMAAGGALLALTTAVLVGVLLPVLLPLRRIGEAEPRSPTPLLPSAIQIGACLVALTMGSLLTRHARVVAGGGGAPVHGSVSTHESAGLTPEQRATRHARLLEQAAAEGGPASLTSPGVLLGLGPASMITTDCGRCSEGGLPVRWRVKAATHRFVSPDSFGMIGIPVLQGRGITALDAWGAPRVAVVSRSLAAREFQDGQAIGRRIRVMDDGAEWSTVVGVVEDAPASGFGAALQPRYSVYLSVLQHPPATVELLTTANSRPGATTITAVVAAQAVPLRWFADAFAGQGYAMLGIAVLGSLAVARLWVASLLVEFGVRRAVGAPGRRIIVYVLARAAAVCGAGLAGGLWFGAAAWGILAGLVTGLEPWDSTAVLGFAGVLVIGTLLGALPSAWRAARATPASLLSAS